MRLSIPPASVEPLIRAITRIISYDQSDVDVVGRHAVLPNDDTRKTSIELIRRLVLMFQIPQISFLSDGFIAFEWFKSGDKVEVVVYENIIIVNTRWNGYYFNYEYLYNYKIDKIPDKIISCLSRLFNDTV
jgi:hypothetical protein